MLKELRSGWDRAAQTDPFFQILTEPGRNWDEASFFERGRVDVAALLDGLTHQPKRGKALDFGCGVGRCTQALAYSFQTVYGVDISPEMVKLARRYDKAQRCVFRVNGSKRLRAFRNDSLDFVYSQFVLQHMPADLQLGYIREFVRVLRPKGIAAFVVTDTDSPDPESPWRAMHGLTDFPLDQSLERTSVVTDNGRFQVVRKP